MNPTFLSAAAAALLAASTAHAVDGFACTLGPASTGSYAINASAPFTGTMIGDTTATPPTRTKAGSLTIFPPFVNCGTFGPTQNDPLAISGAITGSGSDTSIRPTGAFSIFIDPAAGSARVQGLSLNLLGGTTASVAGGLSNFRYPTFCAVDPTCSLPFLTPITLTLGAINVTSLTAAQDAGTATGTLTPAMSGGFDFAIPLMLTITAAASFNGAPFDIAPQTLPIVFAGNIVIAPDGQSATVTSTIDLDIAPPSLTDPIALPPTSFTTPPGSPLCSGLNLILNLTVTSTTFTVDAASTINAPGTRLRCECDWNQSGAVTVQDIFDFLNSYFTSNGDFNGDGGTTVQDVFDFLACFFVRPLPC